MKKASLLLFCVFFFAVSWSLADDVGIKSNGAAGFSGIGVGDVLPEGAVRDTACPDGSLYSQPPHGPDDSWSAATSEVSPGYEVFDNYVNAGGTTNIRFWGLNAYFDDIIGWTTCSENPMTFTITFYTDAGGTPGSVIATFTETLTGVGTGLFFAGSYEMMEYNTILSPAPSLGSSPGWVSIVGSGDPNCWFLWMSSGAGPGDGGYQWDGASLNVYDYDDAFCLYSENQETFDWGDDPDGPYPTLAANNGPNHLIVPGMFLGYSIDAEADGQPSMTALLDDMTGAPDDEDGVVFTQLVAPGSAVNVKVIASVFGFLDGWIDFNADGDWADPGENVFTAQPLNPGVNMLLVSVPAAAVTGVTYSRFRYSTIGGLSWDGPAPDGEVEDYRVFINEPPVNIKWYQSPDLDNTGMDVGLLTYEIPDVDAIADDFLCTQSGPITDIHLWGSFMGDFVPDLPFQLLELTIYSDIPAGGMYPWSMPGEILWQFIFPPGSYLVTQVTDNNPEDYYVNIPQQAWVNDDHFNCYQYDFFIPPENAFIQDEGTIYWLGIRDLIWDGQYRFGWKSTTLDERWNDDAVYLCDPPSYWCEIRYPVEHEFDAQSLDLAFAITGESLNCCDLPGDANNDGAVNILDINYLIAYLYMGGPPPPCMYEGDPNGDCTINILDISYLIAYLYQGGPAPICASNCPGW